LTGTSDDQLLAGWLHNSEESEDSALEPRQPTHGGRANPRARTTIHNLYAIIPYNSFIEEIQGVKQSFHIYFRHSTHKVPPFSRDNNQPRAVSSDVLGFQRKM